MALAAQCGALEDLSFTFVPVAMGFACSAWLLCFQCLLLLLCAKSLEHSRTYPPSPAPQAHSLARAGAAVHPFPRAHSPTLAKPATYMRARERVDSRPPRLLFFFFFLLDV